MKITKLNILTSFLIFLVTSFYIFYNWALSIAADPSYLNAGTAILQYFLVFGTTAACNGPVIWIIGLIIALGIIVYGMVKRNVRTYALLNCALFVIFIIPIILAVTGTSRFCINFLPLG